MPANSCEWELATQTAGNFVLNCREVNRGWRSPRAASVALLLVVLACGVSLGAYGEFELDFMDETTEKLVPVRLQLRGPSGRAPRLRGYPVWRDQVSVPGQVLLKLVPGNYQFEIERGLEYRDIRGNFIIKSGATDQRRLMLQRFVNMAAEGWYSGDLFALRELDDLHAVMQSDDLHMAIGFQQSANKNELDNKGHQTEVPAGKPEVMAFSGHSWCLPRQFYDARGGGRLALVGTRLPDLKVATSDEFPSSASFLVSAKREDPECMALAIDGASQDLPVWLASRQLDAFMLLGPSVLRDRVAVPRIGWRPRDQVMFPDTNGDARWAQYVYFQALNTGLRLALAAGSGSGMTSNPLGQNRVYARIRGKLSWDAWWRAVRNGQTFVTNGPLMTPTVNGELPGHVFRVPAGQTLVLQASLSLYTKEKIQYLELIQDGRVVQSVSLDRWVKAQGRLPDVKFERSGWYMIRAVTDNTKTLRMAATGPYYVEIGEQPSISRSACEFFLQWARDRLQGLALEDPQHRQDVERFHRAAIRYWEQKVASANTD